MSEFGLKITNYKAGSIYEVMCGVRENYDSQDAMLTNSLFSDYIRENGLNIYKGVSTRDVICIEFTYGSRSYEQEIKHLEKIIEETNEKIENGEDLQQKLINLEQLRLITESNKEKFDKKTCDEIRDIFYRDGVDIRYPQFTKDRKIKGYQTIHYKMLYRTPGKAKKGSCMFIRQSLWKKAHDYLWMGIKLPKKNAPIVEIGAYSSLITSTIEGKVKIKPEDILILKDVDSFFETNVISIETDENKKCYAKEIEKYRLKNTLFDGQALIDSSIFPSWADGYILLREHFFKAAAFCTNIQKFFKDHFGHEYDTAIVTDMWGNKHYAKDIKLITTDNAIKWKKFNVNYEYWSEWVHKNDDMFGIVKTAHPSKLGNVQRMSYQMVNALSEDIMDSVLAKSKDYIWNLKTNNEVFFDYLRRNRNFCNDFEVLEELCKYNPDFTRSNYFRERRKEIIKAYVKNLKTGRAIQNADNLVIVGSPYAMLMHSVGLNPEEDPTFEFENGVTQCWTARFEDGEYLAEFRNPFNSRNNLGYMHNHYHEYFDKYFKLGKLCIAVNMIHTDFQDKNNGSDQDSDSIYTTNHPDIVAHAKYCCENYPTIVNNIPMETNHYDNTIEAFSTIDNNLAASQLDIGESSNLAQVCLTYTYNFNDKKFQEYVCILSVLAQAAIDSAKRAFDVNIGKEIKRIKKDVDIKTNGYPAFWKMIRKDQSDLVNYGLKCPMNCIYNINLPSYKPEERTIDIKDFIITREFNNGVRKYSRKIEELIEKYSNILYRYNIDNDEYMLLAHNFEDMINDIKRISMGKKYIDIFYWLLNRTFMITPNINGKKDVILSKLSYNKVLLMKTLFDINKDVFLSCFAQKTV